MNEHQLDQAMTDYFRSYEPDVPPQLHGRIVRSIEARSASRPAFRRLWLAFVAGGATVAVAALIVAIAANGLIYRPVVTGGSPSPSATGDRRQVTPPPTPTLPAYAWTVDPSPPVPHDEPTAEPTFVPPPPEPTPPAIAGAPVTSRTRTGATASGIVRWRFVEPVVATPGRGAGTRILSDIEAVLGSRLKAYDDGWTSPEGRKILEDLKVASIHLDTRYTVYAYVPEPADPTGGLITFRLDYAYDAPWADAGPQWVDLLNYDLKTGARVSITDLFTDPETALQRLSGATVERLGPSMGPLIDGTYAPTAENFSMWAPLPGGLLVKFPAMTITAAVFGSPAFLMSWDEIRDLIKPDSYLAWYVASLK